MVATTRAETMLGDTAVAVHPDDARYTRLVGKTVELPLTGRRIPVVADDHVDPAFGTGAVKVTPAHDPNDFEIGRRHDLPGITILDEHGVVTAHGPFQGLDRFEARPAVVRALREEGRIVAEMRPYVHSVGHCSRCGTTVEPRQSLQWFVRVGPLAQAAGDAVRDGRVRLHPPEMNARYFGWVDDMHDWCISRQLWWGHRIPVFYGPNGQVVCVGPDEQAPAGWRQDPDVLDTWFSSALWPFSTLGWPEDTPDLRTFYPTSVLVTGYDILFFWVARMMMFGLYAMRDKAPEDAVPFRVVALHGLVRDQFGKKMSKSRGNTVDPLDWVDRFGADATRFTLARGANPGGDIAISEEWAAGSRNFCNKLWNAVRFALLNGAHVPVALPRSAALPVPDRWILSRLSAVIAEVDQLFEAFEFGKVCDVLYHFAWDEVCDWYLELAKVPLTSGDEQAAAETTRQVLGFVLDQLLRLLHPVMPFVTEELWTALTGEDSVMVAAWPTFAFTDRGGRGGDLLDDAAGDRDPPVPLGSGAAAGPAGGRPAGGHRGHAAGRARGADPVAAAAQPARGRLHRVGVARGRGHHGRARRGRRHRRRGRAPPDGEGPRGRPSRGGAGGTEAGQRRLHRQGARRRGGQDPPAPRRPPRPTSPAWSSAWPRSDACRQLRHSRLAGWISKRGCARSSGRSSPVGPSTPWILPWTG